MKLIKIQYLSLLAVLIVAGIFVNRWNSLVEAIVTVLFIYWCMLFLAYMLFSYSTKKKNFAISKEGKKVMKIPGGLQVHGVTFKEYLAFIYGGRFGKKDAPKPSLKGMNEMYLKSSKIKEIVVLIFAAAALIAAVVTSDMSVLVKILAIVLGCPALLAVMDFIFVRARYEEGLFEGTPNP